MNNKRRWTTEEDLILVQAITANPHNLTKVFKEVGNKLGRTTKACKLRWYHTLSPAKDTAKTKVSFVSIGKDNMLINRKTNYTSKQETRPISINIWRKIKKFLGL